MFLWIFKILRDIPLLLKTFFAALQLSWRYFLHFPPLFFAHCWSLLSPFLYLYSLFQILGHLQFIFARAHTLYTKDYVRNILRQLTLEFYLLITKFSPHRKIFSFKSSLTWPIFASYLNRCLLRWQQTFDWWLD